MSQKDFEDFVPTLTNRDVALLWNLTEGPGQVGEPEPGEGLQLHHKYEAARKRLHDETWKFRLNPRRLELERILLPIRVATRYRMPDLTGVTVPDDWEQVKVLRHEMAATAGLTPEEERALENELDELERPAHEAESAYQAMLGARDHHFLMEERYSNAMYYSAGKREGWQVAVRLLLLNPSALTTADVRSRVMQSLLDNMAADQIIHDLTQHEIAPPWPCDDDAQTGGDR